VNNTLLQQIKTASYERSQSLSVREEDVSGNELTFSFSSESPVERWWGTEVLSHEKGCARLDRMNDHGAWLFNHNRNILLGSSLKAWLQDDKRAYITVEWSNRDDVKGYRQDCEDGHLTHVSFAYDIYEVVENVKKEEYTVTDWEVFEVSLVTVPADPSVGVGRDRDRPLILGADKPIIILPARQANSPASNPTIIQAEEVKTTVEPTLTPPAAGVSEEAMREQIAQSRQQERDRIRAIQLLGDRHSMTDIGQTAIENGIPIEEFRAQVLDRLGGERQQPIAAPVNPLGLSPREQQSYSILKAIGAIVDGNWKDAGFELECSNEIAKRAGRSTSGFFVPLRDLRVDLNASARAAAALGQERATYAVGGAATGGSTVETVLDSANFIDLLRNNAVVMQMGARMLTGLQGNLDIPKGITAADVYWVSEDNPVGQSEGTFGLVSLRPKTVGVRSKITRMMLLQSSLDIENYVREDISKGIALGIDYAALHGSGVSNVPRGIFNTPGVGSVSLGANGGAPTWDSIVRLETLIAVANTAQGRLGYLTSSTGRGKLKTTPQSQSFTSEFIWGINALPAGFQGAMNGYAAYASNQVRSDLTKGTGTNLTGLIFGNWADLLIGEWGVLEILPNPYAQDDYEKGNIQIRGLQTVDVQLARANSFSAITDMLTTP
jgi:HK97 family phage major capsid protein/HK97 family phage prohead protease